MLDYNPKMKRSNMEANDIDLIPLDKLIGKYMQITKLAAGCHSGGYSSKRSTANKNKRDLSVLHYLLELKALMGKAS